jgi:hypothetical protein
MLDKLASVGLIPKPAGKAGVALGPFLTDYVERRIDVKLATKEVWSQVVRNLLDHFGADRDLAEVTEADAEDFKMFLVGQQVAPTTVHRRLQFARRFFHAARAAGTRGEGAAESGAQDSQTAVQEGEQHPAVGSRDTPQKNNASPCSGRELYQNSRRVARNRRRIR